MPSPSPFLPSFLAPLFDRARTPVNRTRWAVAILCCLCAAYLILSETSLRGKSATVDEFGHLPTGLNLLNSGDFGYCDFHPPLMNMLSAMPLWVSGVKIVYPAGMSDQTRHVCWANGYLFMNQHRAHYPCYVVQCRRVTVALVALLGVVVFAWGRLLAPAHPNRAGLLAATLVWFSPDTLAHAQ